MPVWGRGEFVVIHETNTMVLKKTLLQPGERGKGGDTTACLVVWPIQTGFFCHSRSWLIRGILDTKCRFLFKSRGREHHCNPTTLTLAANAYWHAKCEWVYLSSFPRARPLTVRATGEWTAVRHLIGYPLTNKISPMPLANDPFNTRYKRTWLSCNC